MSELRGQHQTDYNTALQTLNHIHAQALAAGMDDRTLQQVNHHLYTAKFQLKEMTRAHGLGLGEHHDLAHDAFNASLVGAQNALHRHGSEVGDQLSGDLDKLHVDSHALRMDY